MSSVKMDYVIDENLTVLMRSCEKFMTNTDDPTSVSGLPLLARVEIQYDAWFSCELIKVGSSVKWANRLGTLTGKQVTLRQPPLFAYFECIRRSSGHQSKIVIHAKNNTKFDVYLEDKTSRHI